jgi:hypothetical protein
VLRWSRTSVCPASFLSDVPQSGVPFPPPGPSGSVPRLHQYCRTLRFPAVHPAALRCLRLAVPICARLFAPVNGRTLPPQATGFRLPGDPSFRVSCGGGRASQVPGEPQCVHALLSDPGGTSAPGHLGASVLPSAIFKTSAPTTRIFRGSITRPAHSLSTLRHQSYPVATQDSLPAAGQALPGGIGYPLGSYAEFQSSLHLILPAQASPGAQVLVPGFWASGQVV